MSETDPMNIDERRKYLQRMWERYHYASKGDKTMLLDEMEVVTSMHRKSIIRLMQGRRGRKKRERERGKAYGTEVEDAIRVIARSLDQPAQTLTGEVTGGVPPYSITPSGGRERGAFETKNHPLCGWGQRVIPEPIHLSG